MVNIYNFPVLAINCVPLNTQYYSPCKFID